MTNVLKAVAVIAAIGAVNVYAIGTAVAGGFYPESFKYHSDAPASYVGEGSGIPLQYRAR